MEIPGGIYESISPQQNVGSFFASEKQKDLYRATDTPKGVLGEAVSNKSIKNAYNAVAKNF